MSLPSPAPPTGNRFATVTKTDHGALIFIAAILALVFSFLVLFVRFTIVKWRRWGLDDLVLVCAETIGLGQSICIFISYHHGLGKAISIVDVGDLAHMAKGFFASRILLILALCLAKCSLLLSIRTIFTVDLKKQWLTSNITIAIVCAWGAASALAVSVNCSPNYVVSGPQHVQCPNHINRLRAIFILEAMLEFTIVVSPTIFLIGSNMAWSRKVLVAVIFSLRLPTVAFIIVYLVTSTRFISNNSTGVGIADVAVWQQALLGYSLMSVTIPMLKKFVNDFTTGGMGFSKTPHGTHNGSSQNTRQQSTALELSVLSKNSRATVPLPSRAIEPTRLLRRARSASHVSEGIAGDFSSVESYGSRQRIIQ
ncbi:uncharacterized protein EI97DRAFT_504008 [Westerdykella ornata]|uniref:Rhodopsin domain-containing protein n=1 Tax=Westerdykella ornata TaxID=318751 RepID=A0A6A6J9U6_WESOR|nr:uncharacterized protein EI97DRAFT_504008 [Westerdykella ornata]KAF2272758.1 hypothetical protein EI97DRAFT_504008 [Westerdykella ornata]